jgi:hypothetical protein
LSCPPPACAAQKCKRVTHPSKLVYTVERQRLEATT